MIMTTNDKLKVIEKLKTKAEITLIGKQSFSVKHTCGCYFVQHTAAGKVYSQKTVTDKLLTDRIFFAELCTKHKNNK